MGQQDLKVGSLPEVFRRSMITFQVTLLHAVKKAWV